MNALVLESNGKLRCVSDRPLPAVPAGPTALVQVAACGICGSDIGRGFGGKAYHYPLVMGHEFSGVVVEPAPGGRLGGGSRVAVFPLLPCRSCAACATGDFAQCEDYDYYGSRRDGGFAEFVRVPEANLFEVPDGVDLVHASMTEPAAVALHGVRKLNLQAGDRAAVFGAGPIGNLAAQWLRLHGCREVFLVDIDPRKLEVGARMGFTPIHAREVDPVEAIRAATAGKGVERAVEAVGLPRTFIQATQVASRFGEVLLMGNLHGTLAMTEKDVSNILRQELSLRGTWNSKIVPAGTDDWSTVLKFLDRELLVAPLITDRPPLSAGPAIFAELVKGEGFHHKVIFNVSPELSI